MIVTEDIIILLSGQSGYSLSDELDCTCYAFEYENGFVLFDCGVGRNLPLIQEKVSSLGRPITHIFITHAHADHAGGSAVLKNLTNAKLLARGATAHIIESGDTHLMSLDVAKRAGIYPRDYKFEVSKVDHHLKDNEVVRVGKLNITAIPTPGHSSDHTSYLVEHQGHQTLVVGDALFHGGRVALQDIWDCSVQGTCNSIRKLNTLEFEGFLPGHGQFSDANGKRHVELAMNRIAKLCIPELF